MVVSGRLYLLRLRLALGFCRLERAGWWRRLRLEQVFLRLEQRLVFVERDLELHALAPGGEALGGDLNGVGGRRGWRSCRGRRCRRSGRGGRRGAGRGGGRGGGCGWSGRGWSVGDHRRRRGRLGKLLRQRLI